MTEPNVPAVINPGVYWKCMVGACRTPSKCQMTEKCLGAQAMTDLVDRLRTASVYERYQDNLSNLGDEAADEIDRLHRDRISGEAVITKLSFALKRDQAEIERLREALTKMTAHFMEPKP